MAEGIELVDVALADVSSSSREIRETHETETGGMLVNESSSSFDPDDRLLRPHPSYRPLRIRLPMLAAHHCAVWQPPAGGR